MCASLLLRGWMGGLLGKEGRRKKGEGGFGRCEIELGLM